MLKLDSFLSWKIVFKFNGIVFGSLVNKLLSPDHATDLTISSIESFDHNVDFLVGFLYDDIGVFETKAAWEIFIQNGNFANGIITFESVD